MPERHGATADRQRAIRDLKRRIIRDAATEVFAREGIERASVREIARAAGYTTGALYASYATKEELYAEILRESLELLAGELSAARSGAGPGSLAPATLRRLFEFYVERPHDFDLSFYLYGGARPRGLNRVLDRELNACLVRVMALIGRSLVEDGLAREGEAQHAAVSAATFVFGLLLMMKTGRLRSLREDPTRLLEDGLDRLVGRPVGEARG